MTKFRYPTGWNTRREPGQRPNLAGTWLDPRWITRAKHSHQYWTKIHWATPPWMTDTMWSQVKAIYEAAIPGLHEVDHIVPLTHPLVCGLNVPWNLRAVPKRANQQKSNHRWPDCPDHLCPVRNGTIDMFEPHEPYQTEIAL